jgi:hypothetical protein
MWKIGVYIVLIINIFFVLQLDINYNTISYFIFINDDKMMLIYTSKV